MGKRRTIIGLSPGAASGQDRVQVMPGVARPAAKRPLLAGRYRLIRAIGAGGTSTVHLAEHLRIGKRVAIKILAEHLVDNKGSGPSEVERFLREAEGTSRIRHPNVIEISDFGETPEGAPFFVMEYLDGEHLGFTLDRSLGRGGPLPWARVAKFTVQIARGLSAAHAAGVVHRDLKPENCVRITRGHDEDFIKIIDFGIAKLSGGERLTRTGLFVGTPQYMSPEQAGGRDIDHRADIYALGVIMYELLSGRVPFDSDNFMEVLAAHRFDSAPLFAALTPAIEVPAGVEAVVRKALQKLPEHRFATMVELIDAIEALERGLGDDTGAVVEDDAEGRPELRGPMQFVRSGSIPAPALAPDPSSNTRTRGLVLGGLGIAGLLISVALGVSITLASSEPAPLEVIADPAPAERVVAPDRPLIPPLPPATGPVLLRIQTNVDARVLDPRDGAIYGQTNAPEGLRFERGAEPVRLRLEAEGHAPVELELVPDRDRRLTRELEPL